MTTTTRAIAALVLCSFLARAAAAGHATHSSAVGHAIQPGGAPHLTGVVVHDSHRPASGAKPSRSPHAAPRTQRRAESSSTRSSARSKSERATAMHLLSQAQGNAMREKAEAGARSERIYHVSQVSAPIIRDTSACKRVDATGASVYENCALTAAPRRSR